jgi:hypothetical protein
MRRDVYSDAYPLSVPPERLEEAMRVFTSCRLRLPPAAVWRCAKDAAAGTFCPCITAAGGGIGASDRVIFEAVADEIEWRMLDDPVPQATSSQTGSSQTGQGDGARTISAGQAARERVLAEAAIDETLKATFPASDPPAWMLGRSR